MNQCSRIRRGCRPTWSRASAYLSSVGYVGRRLLLPHLFPTCRMVRMRKFIIFTLLFYSTVGDYLNFFSSSVFYGISRRVCDGIARFNSSVSMLRHQPLRHFCSGAIGVKCAKAKLICKKNYYLC